MFVLIGVAVVIVGFALRVNALLVVTVAGIVTAAIGGIGPVGILDAFGNGFASSRSVTTFALVLPVIGLVERYGLQDQAKRLIAKLDRLTTGRLLAGYLVIRQVTAAVGLTSIGGPAQTVRPLVYPMAEGAAIKKYGRVDETMREKIKGYSASSDTVGVFFGEDVFVAVGSILLITTFVDATYDLALEPIDLALWAIPTGIAALLVHGTRLLLFDRKLDRMAADARGATAQAGVAA
ncbi:DUF969 domain-containing protein [Microbacterium sp. M1A1_1b]|uniref:DUF969 domain-containing protein n=1 Tax=Curtobacterium sp. VKM Ac-2922 TaxID=2929475 RepID=UPI001FB44406|nr:DUF969 domain-containing protein [Curtobacterium sp. VKM Ac-2922]MCJ1714369.1 DUF969 domain-containing protein [Curtobacterium sp. VKM Ac-2922]